MPILGILASQITGHLSTNSYESIQTVTVGVGGQSSISFTSIPSTYKHLQIRGIGRTNSGNFYDATQLTFNSDSSASYSQHYLDAYNGTVSASAGGVSATYIVNYYLGGNTSNTFSANIIDILDYANTNKYKTVRSLAGIDANTTGGAINYSSGSWQKTNAITSITFTSTNTIQQYSSFALYGIRG